jgi:hypothetical protein
MRAATLAAVVFLFMVSVLGSEYLVFSLYYCWGVSMNVSIVHIVLYIVTEIFDFNIGSVCWTNEGKKTRLSIFWHHQTSFIALRERCVGSLQDVYH